MSCPYSLGEMGEGYRIVIQIVARRRGTKFDVKIPASLEGRRNRGSFEKPQYVGWNQENESGESP